MISKELTERIKIHLESLLDEPGAILYSSVATLVKGDLYTMGLNPGGEDDIPLKGVLEQLPSRSANAYIDEDWSSEARQYAIGQHPLQLNLTGLLNHLGYNPKAVFSSNLIFSRSPGQDGAKYPERAPICWKVHEELINIVDPKCFIVFGNSAISPFNYMKTKYQLAISDIQPSGHGSWNCYSCGGLDGRQKKSTHGCTSFELDITLPVIERLWIGSNQNLSDMTAKVFIVNHDTQADYKVCIVNHDSQQKNHQIIAGGQLVKYETQANVKVFIVKHESQATIKITQKNFPE